MPLVTVSRLEIEATIREFDRRPVLQRTVGSVPIVIFSPGFRQRPGFFQGRELMLVQTFLPQPSIERLDERIIHGLSRTTKVELHSVEVRKLIARGSGRD